jgi:hypothetical protein
VNTQSIEEISLESSSVEIASKAEPPRPHHKRNSVRINLSRFWALLALITYGIGLGSGYLLWGKTASDNSSNKAGEGSGEHTDMSAMADQINPPEGYKLPIRYGVFGPKLLAAGVIDYEQFMKLYQEIGAPLDKLQTAVLNEGSNEPVVINKDNKQFLLNLFWALGLVNQNKILTDGPMMQNGKDQVVKFASTGGWTIGAKPVSELYASQSIITLTVEQQARLEEVAQAVYRPCCDNPTHFPDCNHGMAMLGLLELMASQGATVDAMFEAAKYVNAFWFPQQTLEAAMVFKAVKNVDFVKADARSLVGRAFSSGTGSQSVHQWLVQNGKLQQAPQGGGSCAVK